MPRYKLHPKLGGHRVALLRRNEDGTADIVVDLGDESFPAQVPITVLDEYEDPLPPEPPHESVVRVKDRGIWQSFHGAWEGTISRERKSWAQMCELGTPVPMVPNPLAEPVELPWHVADVSVRPTADYGIRAIRVAVDQDCAFLSPDHAREMARALWAAASAADEVS